MFRKSLLLGVLAAAVLITHGTAYAQSAYVYPGYQPRLGFQGHMEYGFGLRIDYVEPYSLARNAGLERGDVITRVNGVRVQSFGHYLALLRSAGGYVVLGVYDVRGRGTISVPVWLDGGYGGPVYGSRR